VFYRLSNHGSIRQIVDLGKLILADTAENPLELRQIGIELDSQTMNGGIVGLTNGNPHNSAVSTGILGRLAPTNRLTIQKSHPAGHNGGSTLGVLPLGLGGGVFTTKNFEIFRINFVVFVFV